MALESHCRVLETREFLLDRYLDVVDLRPPKLVSMRKIANEMQIAIGKKIKKGTAYPTFLHPTSQEKIKEFSGKETIIIEIGGTNMRSNNWKNVDGLMIPQVGELKGQLKKNDQATTTFDSPEDFFDSLFNSMPGLIDTIKKNPNALLSIIFSFEGKPVETDQGLDYIVTRLSKGFIIPGMVEQPGMAQAGFITLLNQYLKEKHEIQEPRKMALFNDTAILAKKIGLVVGTGYNYAINMKVGKLREILGPNFAKGWDDEEEMIVNLEAANMGGIATKFAGERNPNSIFSRVDRKSTNSGQAQEEKLIAGGYLGQSLKEVLLDLNRITRGKAVVGLEDDTIIRSSHLTNILKDGESEDPLPFRINPNYRAMIKAICTVIRDRAAYNLASLLVGGIEFTSSASLEALTDGSTFWGLPGFREKVTEGIRMLKGPNFEVIFTNTKADTNLGSQYYGALAGLQYFHDRQEREERTSTSGAQ
jgi:hexokinase